MKKIKLGDACEILNGFAFKSENYVGSGIRVIRISNVQKGYIEDNTPAFYPLETKGLEKYMLEEGDLLISLTGNVGRVAILEKEFMPAALNQRVACLRLKTDKLSKRYLFHILNSDFFEKQCIQYSKGVAQKNMSTAWLKDYEILLYSKEQQELIADILDKMRLIKKSRYYELQKLDELVKARFVEMFGDPNIEFKYSSVKFNDLVARMTKGPFGSDMKKDLFVPKGEDTYKVYIQINAIQKNQSLGEYYISKEYFDRKVSRFELFPNDYIITCDGTLGKYLKLDENMEKGVISPSLLRLTLQNDKINDKYFENIWDFYMLGLMKKEARNACLVHLPSAKKIGEILIPVPPLELQNQFASFVQEIDKSRLLSNHSLFLIKSLIF
ncbi:restriction endonuclease subunit S [uncultured Catenibacterium sp.]|mgnify:CR=1 FL=1|uniref:restriction endonuclease subunit S n=1 Tax=uncultured Catenibacterium sp. TaxID=286142 RepID=UPI00258C79B1|nr:restriction endonuclease subunit S [uncultured Catenibacterium sp.]